MNLMISFVIFMGAMIWCITTGYTMVIALFIGLIVFSPWCAAFCCVSVRTAYLLRSLEKSDKSFPKRIVYMVYDDMRKGDFHMNLTIVGAGTMGRITCDMALQNPGIEKVWNVEPALGESIADGPEPDIVIDFSHPGALGGICDYIAGKQGRVGVVFATTGYSPEEEEKIRQLSEIAPVIKSSNYSYGINSLKKIISFAAPILQDCSDIEIVEKHHNQKVDAPSGTALTLAELCDPEHGRDWKCGRKGEEKRRNEIGIHSIRGGTIFGEHTVIFAMKDEVIEIKHTAFSRKIFAKGAIEAALWLRGKKPGYYRIEDVFY